MDLSIFKSYDIRGAYPKNLDGKLAYKIGQSFAKKTKAGKVAVGRDMRLSSPILFKEIIKGIISQGADVYDLGLVPVEFVYFALGRNKDYDAGIMVTASHEAKEYNGFKMIKREREKISVLLGRDLIKVIEEGYLPEKEEKGNYQKIDLWQPYLKHIFSFVNLEKIRRLRIVVDAGNGLAGKVIPLLAEKLPVEIIPLNFELDGNFPARPSNPLAEGAPAEAKKRVKGNKADFGVLFDGDADRLFLIDEKGNFIRGDITLLLLAKHFLENSRLPKSIAYSLICSQAVPKFIKEWGGTPIKTKVGWANIREAEIDNKAVMGGELSGHFSFKGNFYFDSGFISFLILLEVISSSRKKLSQLRKEFSPFPKTPEINFQAENKAIVIEKIKNFFSDGKQSLLDGLTVEYDKWWFNLRPSQTEPLLRLVIEANNKEELEEKKNLLVDLIKKAGGVPAS